jgi:hypothetical protein
MASRPAARAQQPAELTVELVSTLPGDCQYRTAAVGACVSPVRETQIAYDDCLALDGVPALSGRPAA